MKRYTELPDNDAICQWINDYIDARVADESRTFESITGEFPVPEITAESALGEFIAEHKLEPEAVFTLLFLFAATCNPQTIDRFSSGKRDHKRLRMVEDALLPSGYTLSWLLAGNNGIKGMTLVEKLLNPKHVFNKKSILQLSGVHDSASAPLNGVLQFVPGVLEMFLTNRFQPPRFGDNFPARLLTTTRDFDQMIHPEYLREKMRIVVAEPAYEKTMREKYDMGEQMPLGYRVLMSGPPGTGKSMAAAVLGACMMRDVYQVMIHQVMNKYVGETEKNLDRLFNMAEGKGWILFFDEADAIFGTRGEEGKEDAGSRNRNEVISYLLQRFEHYNGIIFCATNLENNMDIAFKRRFQMQLRFSLPTETLRCKLWEQYLPDFPRESRITIEWLSKFTLPPSAIANVCNRVMMYALHFGYKEIRFEDIDHEIKIEMRDLGI
ncbi:MAG: AAA ATPase [Bacteroidetes bacterium]|nr:MAG: AAA ATPase [Bacteroidota bacterium]